MFIGSIFESDDDVNIMRIQHNSYGDALYIIQTGCMRHIDMAKSMILHDSNRDNYKEWGHVPNYTDHRTLQWAHDLLAAAWRYSLITEAIPLVFAPPGKIPYYNSYWLSWLRDEIDSWWRFPEMVRAVQIILLNQNMPFANHAEKVLAYWIVYKFDKIPWNSSRLDFNEIHLEDFNGSE